MWEERDPKNGSCGKLGGSPNLRLLGRSGKLQLMMMAGKGHVPVVPSFRSWFTRERMLGELPPPKKNPIYIRNLFKFAQQNMQVKVFVMMKFNERIGGVNFS